jgi:YD repeat-containing protein
MMSMRRLYALVGLIVAAPLLGEQHPNVARGFQADKVYQFGDVDHVNLYNGNLSLTIPIGSEYSGNGTLRYRFALFYNSKAWDQEVYQYENSADYSYCHPSDPALTPPECGENYVYTKPTKSSNAGMGWLLTLGRLLSPTDPAVDAGGPGQLPPWTYEGTDGAQHSFLASGSSLVTVDGSFLRLVSVGSDFDVVFPDGLAQRFELIPGSTNNSYRLKDIRDPFGNHLAVTYSGMDWTLSEYAGSGTGTLVRQHFVRFHDTTTDPIQPGNVGPNYHYQVSEIDLAAFGSARAVYALQYTTDPIHYGCHGDFRLGDTPTIYDPNAFKVPRLRHIVLPDGSQWDADYFSGADGSSDLNRCSAIQRLTLPTKATIEWLYTSYTLPTTSCRTPAQPNVYHEDAFFESVDGVSAKKLTVNGQPFDWSYTQGPDLKVDFPCNNSFMKKEQESITTVVGPDTKTIHYFSVWSGMPSWQQGSTSTSFFDRSEYGLPFTRSSDSGCAHTPDATELCLSAVEYECPGGQCKANPSRYHYVRYEGDSRQALEGLYNYGYRREVAHQTKFCEDVSVGGCQTSHSIDVVRSAYDGLGHYRQVAASGSGIGGARTEFTNYNPSVAAVTVDPLTWSNTPQNWPASAPSLLNLFDSSSSATTGKILKSEFCFDSSSGFLDRKRTFAGTAGQSARNDLLAVFDHDTFGNVIKERYFGGDPTKLDDLGNPFNTCSGSISSTAAGTYTLTHAYSTGGSLMSTEYPGLLKTLDLVIDANSGLPSSSSDPAGLATSYLYDTQNRLTEEHPPALPWTQYTYNATATPPNVAITQRPYGSLASAAALTDRRLYFDGLGRLMESRTQMPDGWSTTQTRYDGLGRAVKSYMPEYRSNGTYESNLTLTHYQQADYDPFGRVVKITAPDAKVTTITYTGVRALSRKQTVNAATDSTTTETYDSLGRLLSVDEPSLDGSHSNTTTTYEYDPADRLTQVTMDDHTASDLQTRTFNYDGRGFLQDETHPELGKTGKAKITYEIYDARGHVARKLVGDLDTGTTASDFDLKYTYDAAERLTDVDQILNRSSAAARPLKHFDFATANDTGVSPANNRKGKIEKAIRYNYPSTLGTITPPPGNFKVTDTLHYQNGAGLLSSRDTLVEHNNNGTLTTMQQTTQGYGYDSLGDLSDLTYPVCPNSTCAMGTPITSPLLSSYSDGRLISIAGYATSFKYQANGMVSELVHGQNGGVDVKDKYTGDDSGMLRPKKIEFTGWDDCVPPSPSINSSGEVCPSSANTASVSITGATYLWQITNGSINSGATSDTVHYTAGASGNVVLTVTVTNSCGNGSGTKSVAIGPTAQITSSSSTIKAGATTEIQVALTGTPPWSVTWMPGNVVQGNITSSPASKSFTPSSTTTYSISSVSDQICAGTVSGGPVTITVLPPPANFSTSKSGAAKNSKDIVLQWDVVQSATSYVIERTAQLPGGWVTISPPNCQPTGGVMRCTDSFSASNIPSPVSFVYRVSAAANGVTSDPSAIDYATVANQLFSDEPLQANTTRIYGRHVSELRAAIDAVRYAAGPTTPRKWWPNYPAQTGLIYAVHFYDAAYANNLSAATDLRNVLDEAVLVIRHGRLGYTAPAPATGVKIYAYQVEEIRAGVK